MNNRVVYPGTPPVAIKLQMMGGYSTLGGSSLMVTPIMAINKGEKEVEWEVPYSVSWPEPLILELDVQFIVNSPLSNIFLFFYVL